MTFNQLIRKGREKKIKKSKSPILNGCPQKRGVCVKVTIMKPKKPNSANRKVVRVRVAGTKKEVYCYVPYEGHSLQEHSVVLFGGTGPQDLPGCKYSLIRNKYGLSGVVSKKRMKGRSKAGVKKPSK